MGELYGGGVGELAHCHGMVCVCGGVGELAHCHGMMWGGGGGRGACPLPWHDVCVCVGGG